MTNFRNRSVTAHQFSMVPRPDVPRAAFNIEFTHKTTLDAGYLIPIMCEEVLPGDSFNVGMTAFARLATPIFPLMDNIHIDTFFFYCPNRLVWDNWVRFMGEQDQPSSSISYVIPQLTAPTGGFAIGSLGDYFGLPTVGAINAASNFSVSAIPFRMYNLIYNQWFRDQNLIQSGPVPTGDGPDTFAGNYLLRRRAKRPDYFTTALPWPQKGGTAVSLPLGTTAPVVGLGGPPTFNVGVGPGASGSINWTNATDNAKWSVGANPGATFAPTWVDPQLEVDLSSATAATINQIRQAFQIQRLLERDARGGTRYTEIVQSHFGVRSPDARLQRPEYLGGGSTPMMVTPIAQQSATGVTGGSTPLGSLAGIGTGVARHGFSQSFVEHGYVIGLVNIRADINYQQGIRRHWSRETRYDFYFPAFAHLGEQAILNKEIYAQGSFAGTVDDDVFGYQERWSELRYSPSLITGLFRSTATGTLDAWHLAQRFTALPVLGQTFIEDNPPLSRVLAVGAGANGAQVILDTLFRMRVARPLPLYSVPGLIDHF